MGIAALLMQANALVDLKSPRSEKKVASDVLCLQGFRLALQLNLYTLLSDGVFLTCRFVLKYFAKLAQTIWLNNKEGCSSPKTFKKTEKTPSGRNSVGSLR